MKKDAKWLGFILSISLNTAVSQYLTIRVTDNVNLLVIDNSGRRTGFDPVKQVTVIEIPNSGYSLEGVGYIGDNENAKTDDVYELWIADSNNTGPFSLLIVGTYGGRYGLRIARGIQNRYIDDITAYIPKGGQHQFSLGFSANNAGALVRSIGMNSLKEDLQSIFSAGDMGDEHFFDELMKDVDRFEGALQKTDTSNAVKILERFQEVITKEYEKGIKQSRNRYVRPDAWKILHDDAQSLIDRLPLTGKPEKPKEKK